MSNSETSKYYMPTRIIKGKDCIIQNSNFFKTLGKKALIVTGAQSAKANGSENDVRTALELEGIDYVLYDKVMNNPTISCVYEGSHLAADSKADFIIAIGGGSPMDAGKAIALLAAQDVAEENLFANNFKNIVLPIVAVPTTAGTGSEVTQYSILTNHNAQTKTSIASDLLFPNVAFLDATYTLDLPIEVTINTAIDALSHAIEGMLSIRSSTISNILALESIRMIKGCIPVMLEVLQSGEIKKIDFYQREQLLQASCLAGMVIAQTGTTIVHAMGYSLTYFKNIDHGRANGLLLGEYLRLVEKGKPELVGRILESLDLFYIDDFKSLINSLLRRNEALDIEEINHYSKIAIKSKNLTNSIVKPDEEGIREIFLRSLDNAAILNILL